MSSLFFRRFFPVFLSFLRFDSCVILNIAWRASIQLLWCACAFFSWDFSTDLTDIDTGGVGSLAGLARYTIWDERWLKVMVYII